MARGNSNPSRFHGLALGKYNNFKARTDGLITEADTTPDVSLYSLLYANNSSNVSITDFDEGAEGQIIYVVNLGSDLSFTRSSTMLVTDSSNLVKNDSISFIKHASAWYELSRSHSAASSVQYAIELSANNASIVGGVANTRVLVINNSGATVISGISGGYVGQILTIVNTLSAVTLSHNALILNEGSGGVGFILETSAAVSLVHLKGGKWLPIREAYTGANPA
jgi:hypothetical protein